MLIFSKSLDTVILPFRIAFQSSIISNISKSPGTVNQIKRKIKSDLKRLYRDTLKSPNCHTTNSSQQCLRVSLSWRALRFIKAFHRILSTCQITDFGAISAFSTPGQSALIFSKTLLPFSFNYNWTFALFWSHPGWCNVRTAYSTPKTLTWCTKRCRLLERPWHFVGMKYVNVALTFIFISYMYIYAKRIISPLLV